MYRIRLYLSFLICKAVTGITWHILSAQHMFAFIIVSINQATLCVSRSILIWKTKPIVSLFWKLPALIFYEHVVKKKSEQAHSVKCRQVAGPNEIKQSPKWDLGNDVTCVTVPTSQSRKIREASFLQSRGLRVWRDNRQTDRQTYSYSSTARWNTFLISSHACGRLGIAKHYKIENLTVTFPDSAFLFQPPHSLQGQKSSQTPLAPVYNNISAYQNPSFGAHLKLYLPY